MRETDGLHRLKVDNDIFLDEKRLCGIREYSIVQNEEDNRATLTIQMDVTINNTDSTDKDKEVTDVRANLTLKKIADRYAECDVRLVTDNDRDVKYVSERIVNIKELESFIEKAYVSVELLMREIEKENVNNQQIIRLLKDTREALEKANNFEICIERRTTL